MSLNESLLEQGRTRWFSANQKEKLYKLRSDAWTGRWKEVYKLYEQERELRTEDITGTGDTVLHMAVSSGKTHLVKNIVDLLERDDIVPRDVEEGRHVNAVLGAENHRKNTPLHLAAINGNVEMCNTICDSYKYASLIKKRNVAGETPLFLAVRYGMKEAFIWLHRRYMESPGDSSANFVHCARDNEDDTILHRAIAEGYFDVAFEIVNLCKDHMKEMMTRNKKGLTPLHLLAAQPSAFKSWGLLELPSFLRPIDGRSSQIRKGQETHKWALYIMIQLLEHASEEDMKKIISKEVDAHDVITIETPLMIAAKNGAVEMVEKILELFPSTINDVNTDRKNILLLAVEYRQTKVCMFLSKQKWLTESLFEQEDKDGNNALHLAATFRDEQDIFSLWDAFFMSKEIEFFQFVKNLVPRSLLEGYNKKKDTPTDVLRKCHKELMKCEGEWAAKTANACFVVSTLLATMGFYHLTTSFDENNYSSLASFSFSLSATISFLAILAFPYQSLHYWKYVPVMLHIAILSMLASMLCLWISFMLHGHSLALYIILGSAIAVLTIVLLPIFIGPTLMAMFTLIKVPAPSRNITSAIWYRSTGNSTSRN